jgi:hypothetical protein
VDRASLIPGATLAALGLTVNPVATAITTSEAFNNPFMLRNTTRVRDFELVADTYTDVEGFYIQDDFKIARTFSSTSDCAGTYQQAYGAGSVTYLKLNNFKDNTQPRPRPDLGFHRQRPRQDLRELRPLPRNTDSARRERSRRRW